MQWPALEQRAADKTHSFHRQRGGDCQPWTEREAEYGRVVVGTSAALRSRTMPEIDKCYGASLATDLDCMDEVPN